MAKYYFHLVDGHTILDDRGLELSNIADVQHEAIKASSDLLRGHAPLWNGEPWKMWVTDKPNGEGNVIVTLTFTASASSQ